MNKKFLINFLYNYFDINNIKDSSQNGLQVDNSKDEIKSIAFCVDATLESIEAAKKRKADLLFVHHGLFWSNSQTITGAHYRRIAELIKHDIALFAVHLPLDLNENVGNNITMAKKLNLNNIKKFGDYKGIKIGFIGESADGLSAKECSEILGFNDTNDLKIYNFHQRKNKKIAIISGGAADDVNQAIEQNAELFISGEHSHTAYHIAKEGKINLLLGGHYKSEVFGVQESAKMLKERFPDLDCFFIDLPTQM